MKSNFNDNYLQSFLSEDYAENHLPTKVLSLNPACNVSLKAQGSYAIGTGSVRESNHQSLGLSAIAKVPCVELVGARLSFEGRSLDFGRQNLMIKLFQIFLQSKECRVSRLELIKRIYGHQNLSIANRKVLTDFHNIVKLISRARKICEHHFLSGTDRSWVWFDYDPFASDWVLIKPRHVQMVLSQEG